jgi:hypothetical protein
MVNKMNLEKEDFGIYDDEELSIIKKGYKPKEISDYILSIQDELKNTRKNNDK